VTLIAALCALPALSGCASGGGGGATTENVQFGVMVPLTGPYAEDGPLAKKGAKLAMKELKSSGVLGKKSDILLTDNQADPQVSVSAFNQMLSIHDVPASITTFSGPSLAIAPIATREGVALINTGGVTPQLVNASPYLFDLVPLETQQAAVMLQYLAHETDVHKVALMYSNDALGKGTADVFGEAAKNAGLDLVGKVSFDPESSDYRSSLNKLASLKPDAVYTTPSADQAGEIIKQGSEIGFEPLWCGYSGFGHSSVIDLGGSAAEGSYYTVPTTTNPETGKPFPKAQKYLDAYASAYGAGGGEDYFTQTAYAAISLFGEASKRLQKSGKDITGENIADELHSGTFDTIFGPLTFNKDGTSVQPIAIRQIKNGKFVTTKVYGADDLKSLVG
jgi:branched-chain amino acid transport system substrate-binding protein